MKIKVWSRGETEIDADAEYTEPAIREALNALAAGAETEPGCDIANTIVNHTDTDKSNISHDEYAIVTEDDGTELWRGWLIGDPEEPAPEGASAPRPRIVCLCGSTRFYDEFRRANLQLTLAGQIVLSIGCDTKSDGDLAAAGELDIDPSEVKARLDDLHKRKVDLADYVLVVSDEAGYFGQSTAGEIAYAVKHGKPVLFANKAAAERAKATGLLSPEVTPCRQPHTADYQCFDCATDDEIAASIPPFLSIGSN